MPAKTDPREGLAADQYYYRRSLSARDAWPAVVAGVAAGAAVFYLATILLRKTPLLTDRDEPGRRRNLSRPRA